MHTAVSILPSLILLLTVIGMLRASGGLDRIAAWLSPLFHSIGVPPETAPLAMIRPLSGSGALAALEDTLQAYGADSIAGRTASVMMSCTETVFYTMSLYFLSVGIRKTRYTLPCALLANLVGIFAAVALVRLVF